MELRALQEALEEFIFVAQAHTLGVIERLHREPMSAGELARAMGFDLRCASALLEGLAEMGYLAKRDQHYVVPADVAARLVDSQGDQYEGDFWRFLYYLLDPWRTLPAVLATGRPDTESYRNFSIGDFIRAMNSPWKKRAVPEIVDRCLARHPDARSVIDVGGAPGAVAREFAARGLQVCIYDLPESNAVLGRELAAVPGISVADGDATKEFPDGVFDIAFLGNICHGQSVDDNARMIRMARDRIAAGGIIVIFDNIRGESYLGARLAMHMITQSPGGNVYTRDEYFGWLADAGFQSPAVEHLSDRAWQLIIARK
ncbi:MAG TPA: methyltransferase [Spirochaetota bacterium]|nr:methyltransferase [Spirochaetota bacterium]HOS40912.1 methyltransferase [Spirochaetota bacterium]HPI22370.1 methyltransferase [Spirochaetota bacterium]HPU88355.1 methyltransferase [Spirochaetota bacterium]